MQTNTVPQEVWMMSELSLIYPCALWHSELSKWFDKKNDTENFQKPGYSAEMKQESLDSYEYPNGTTWQKLFAEGTLYKHPDEE